MENFTLSESKENLKMFHCIQESYRNVRNDLDVVFDRSVANY